MNAFFRLIVRRRRLLTGILVVLLAASVLGIPLTEINYDDTRYLPAGSNTKAGLAAMAGSFGGGGTATAMLSGATLEEILDVKARLSLVGGVDSVIWLDDLFLPLLTSPSDLTDGEKLSYLLRVLEALPRNPEMGAADLGLALTKSFTQEELEELAPLMQDLMANGFGMTDLDLGAMLALGQSGSDFGALAAAAEAAGVDVMELIQPLGEDYILALDGMEAELGRFYTDGSALYNILFTEGDYGDATAEALREINAMDAGLLLSGNAASAYYSRVNQMSEILRASVMMAALVLVILFLFSSSWLEPVLYLISIAAAILMNMGSNPLLGPVSYLTESVACILQMALSMDYSIFLLNRYKKERRGGLDKEEAMVQALRSSFSAISASSVTTIACFVTIMFMKYTMGLDMGLVMTKGILLSLLTVFLFLPGLIVYCDKGLQKTEHKTFRFRCEGLSRLTYRGRWVLLALAVVLILPASWISGQNQFVYGSSASQGEESRGLTNRREIEAVFGTQEQLALLLPKDSAAELALVGELSKLEGVTSVTSWAETEESGYAALVPAAMRRQLEGSGDYDRMILLLDCPEESPETRALLQEIRQAVEAAYPHGEDYYLLGNTAAAEDLEDSTSRDFGRISWYSVAAVAVIVALTFRSLLTPLVLVAVIEGAVWINMSIPYLLGNPMIFLGYMIISNILLGSTIDYAILLTSNYRAARRTMDVREALREAQRDSVRPILTSGIIFAVGGLILGLTSTFPTVQLLGYAIMRGGVCAMVMTILNLPAILAVLDKAMRKSK